jgi:hypothetical protein
MSKLPGQSTDAAVAASNAEGSLTSWLLQSLQELNLEVDQTMTVLSTKGVST